MVILRRRFILFSSEITHTVNIRRTMRDFARALGCVTVYVFPMEKIEGVLVEGGGSVGGSDYVVVLGGCVGI